MNEAVKRTPIIAFASGKGGVGKTSLCLNTASVLTKMGKKVLVFDGDLGLGNIDVQLGMTPAKDLSHVLQGLAQLEEIVAKSDRGFHVIPGRSGAENLPFISALERRDILKKLRDLAGSYDAVLLDVAAGVNDEVLGFANFADRTVLVITPDPSSITDGYAVVKLLKHRYDKNNCEVIINQCATETEGDRTYSKIHTAAKEFLECDVPMLGMVHYDRDYSLAVKMQQLVTIAYPNAKSSNAIEEIAKKLVS